MGILPAISRASYSQHGQTSIWVAILLSKAHFLEGSLYSLIARLPSLTFAGQFYVKDGHLNLISLPYFAVFLHLSCIECSHSFMPASPCTWSLWQRTHMCTVYIYIYVNTGCWFPNTWAIYYYQGVSRRPKQNTCVRRLHISHIHVCTHWLPASQHIYRAPVSRPRCTRVRPVYMYMYYIGLYMPFNMP